MGKENDAIASEVTLGFLPVRKEERSFRFVDLLLIQTGIGISCFGLLVGIYTGLMLDAKQAIAAILFGNAMPVLLIMPIAILFSRYGVDTFVGFRSALGYKGAQALFILFLLTNFGFLCVACFMAGETTSSLIGLFSGNEFLTGRTTGAPLFGIIIFLIGAFVAFKGPKAIKWFNWIGIPAFLFLLACLIVQLLFGEGLDKIFGLQPAAPLGSNALSFATAVEINVGLGFSWLVYIGQYSRMAKTEKSAFTSGFWSYGVLVNVAAVLGAFGALVSKSAIPSDIMSIFNPTFEVIGLLLLIAGNLAAIIFLFYSQGVSVKTAFPKLKWGLSIASALPTVLLIVSPVFYDSYSIFIAIVSYTMAVLGGVVIVDFYFVKKQRVSVRDLYDHYGAYTYWKGVNPSAIASFIVGTIVYWQLYNPLTGETSTMFTYVTAGLFTYFVSGICFYICSKFIFSYEAEIESEYVSKESARNIS